jgi:hypothetical protein
VQLVLLAQFGQGFILTQRSQGDFGLEFRTEYSARAPTG